MGRKRSKGIGTRKLFAYGQSDLFEKSYEEVIMEKKDQSVRCLGMNFPNDEERRKYFLEKLREKLHDPEFRNTEGFPFGSDEDILALSDPPYYTACPSPFIDDFVRDYGKPYDPNTDQYVREPFAADVSEGKNDPIYNAHSYHTKVPHKAIMRYILHYTEPGDIVFDGFCGTGMTGVAAQLCGDKAVVESLDFKVDKDGTVNLSAAGEKGKTIWKPFSRLGSRLPIQNDLSPAATFIAYNYNNPVDLQAFEREARRILNEVEVECGWMYETIHVTSKDGKKHEEVVQRVLRDPSNAPWIRGGINYVVWSDVFICPECAQEVVYWEAAVDKKAGKVEDEFPCLNCRAMLTKRHMGRAWVTRFDSAINQTIRQAKQVPVLINYSVNKKRYEKKPDAFDLAVIEKIERIDIPYWFPTDRMPEGDEARRNDDIGITHVHHFYTKRNLWVLAAIFDRIHSLDKDRFQKYMMIWFTSSQTRLHRMNRYMAQHGRHVGPLSGTLYLSSSMAEISPMYFASAKINDHSQLALPHGRMSISTNSAEAQSVCSQTIDYIFTDPPFGGNLMYSELNFLWEAWLRVFTNNKPEAIENSVQGKGLLEYKLLMTKCFCEYFRVLKPGRWLTVEFHNSKNSVWNAIQESLQIVGFVIADVRTLDKQKGTTKQLTLANATKQDLIISAYKPNGGLEERFKLEAGTEKGVWDFILTHLKQLPVFVSKDGQAEVTAERQNYLLFDRMVAFHVQRGVTIPLSASEFYHGLTQRFPERDGMYFLPEQVAEYDKKRMAVRDVLQLQLFVLDESTAIQWLKQQLNKKPQTFQELHPQFLREIAGWQKQEKTSELSELLAENFLRYDGQEEVPNQIHGYLSTNFREFRNLAKDDPALRAKAKDRWYVADPNKARDLEKLRDRALLREFEDYREAKQTRLKVIRLEAVRAGFRKAWQERDYATIIAVAKKIPENVLQEDPKLLMWYDQAMTRAGE